jgi:hypothetical protein
LQLSRLREAVGFLCALEQDTTSRIPSAGRDNLNSFRDHKKHPQIIRD